MRQAEGVKIYFDAVSTAAREDAARDLAAQVYNVLLHISYTPPTQVTTPTLITSIHVIHIRKRGRRAQSGGAGARRHQALRLHQHHRHHRVARRGALSLHGPSLGRRACGVGWVDGMHACMDASLQPLLTVGRHGYALEYRYGFTFVWRMCVAGA